MRDRARLAVRNVASSYTSGVMGQMGPLKSFGDLQDSIMKLRENFDVMLGKIQEPHFSPLKKKDLMNEF